MLISITDIIVGSIHLYRHNFRLFATYALMIFVPSTLTTILVPVFALLIPEGAGFGTVAGSFIAYAVVAIILSAFSFWISIGFVRVMGKKYAGQTPGSVGTELGDARKLFWPAVGVSILTALAALGGILLIVIPGIIFGVWFAFAFYGTIIDNHGVIDSMKYSKSLIDGRWWSVFLRLLVPALVFGVLILIVNNILGVPFQMALESAPKGSMMFQIWAIIAVIIIKLVSSLLTPFSTAATIILYAELKKTPKETPVPVSTGATPPPTTGMQQ